MSVRVRWDDTVIKGGVGWSRAAREWITCTVHGGFWFERGINMHTYLCCCCVLTLVNTIVYCLLFHQKYLKAFHSIFTPSYELFTFLNNHVPFSIYFPNWNNVVTVRLPLILWLFNFALSHHDGPSVPTVYLWVWQLNASLLIMKYC